MSRSVSRIGGGEAHLLNGLSWGSLHAVILANRAKLVLSGNVSPWERHHRTSCRADARWHFPTPGFHRAVLAVDSRSAAAVGEGSPVDRGETGGRLPGHPARGFQE